VVAIGGGDVAASSSIQSVPYSTVVDVYQAIQTALTNVLKRKGDTRNNAMSLTPLDVVAKSLQDGRLEVAVSGLDTISYKDKRAILQNLGLNDDRVDMVDQLKTGGSIKSVLSIPVDLLGYIAGNKSVPAAIPSSRLGSDPNLSMVSRAAIVVVLGVLIIYGVTWAVATPFDKTIQWIYDHVPGAQYVASRFAKLFHAEQLINTKPPPPPQQQPPPKPPIEQFSGEDDVFDGLNALRARKTT
jgi:hypothetical protein